MWEFVDRLYDLYCNAFFITWFLIAINWFAVRLGFTKRHFMNWWSGVMICHTLTAFPLALAYMVKIVYLLLTLTFGMPMLWALIKCLLCTGMWFVIYVVLIVFSQYGE